MLAYFIVYLMIFCMGVFQYYSKKKFFSQNVFLIVSFILLFILLGYRGPDVGEDTYTYLKIANLSSRMSWKDILVDFPRTTIKISRFSGLGYKIEDVETLYIVLNKIIMLIFNSALSVQVFVAFVICFGFMIFLKNNSENIFLSVFVFFCESCFMSAFNGQRQLLAMAIGVNVFTFIKDKMYKKALFLILLASLFHTASLIFLFLIPLSFVSNYKVGMKYSLVISACAIFSLDIMSNFVEKFFPYYAHYLTSSWWEAKLGGTIIIWSLEILIIIMMYKCGIRNKSDFILCSSTMFCLSWEIIGLEFSVLSRVALFFREFLILLFPAFYKYLSGKKVKFLYFCMVMVILFFQLLSYAAVPSRFYSFY